MPSRKIEDLHPLFQPMVSELLFRGQEAIGTEYKFFITDGIRSMQEQTDLYAQGRTKAGAIVTHAKAGESAHNYGLAVDLEFQKEGKLFYTASLYNKVYPIAKTLGFVLGKDWSDFPDKPHFEYPNWRQVINAPKPPSGGGTDMSTIQLDKATFEKLVANSTKWDALSKAGFPTVADVEAVIRMKTESDKAAQMSAEEAKSTRESFALYRSQVAEALQSPQDIDRVKSAITDILNQLDQATRNSKKDSEENAEYEAQIIKLKSEVVRLDALLNNTNVLTNVNTDDLLRELFKRLKAILVK